MKQCLSISCSALLILESFWLFGTEMNAAKGAAAATGAGACSTGKTPNGETARRFSSRPSKLKIVASWKSRGIPSWTLESVTSQTSLDSSRIRSNLVQATIMVLEDNSMLDNLDKVSFCGSCQRLNQLASTEAQKNQHNLLSTTQNKSDLQINKQSSCLKYQTSKFFLCHFTHENLQNPSKLSLTLCDLRFCL